MLRFPLILILFFSLPYAWAEPKTFFRTSEVKAEAMSIGPGGFSVSCFSHHNSRKLVSYFMPLVNREEGHVWWDTGTILLDSRVGYRKVMGQPIFAQSWFWGIYGGYDAYAWKGNEIYYLKHAGLEIGLASLGQLTINYYQAPKIPAEGVYQNFAGGFSGLFSKSFKREAITCLDDQGMSVKFTRALLKELQGSILFSYSKIEKLKNGICSSEGVYSFRVCGQYALHSRTSIQLEYILVDKYIKGKQRWSIGIRYSDSDSNAGTDMFQGRLKRPPEMYIPQYFDHHQNTNTVKKTKPQKSIHKSPVRDVPRAKEARENISGPSFSKVYYSDSKDNFRIQPTRDALPHNNHHSYPDTRFMRTESPLPIGEKSTTRKDRSRPGEQPPRRRKASAGAPRSYNKDDFDRERESAPQEHRKPKNRYQGQSVDEKPARDARSKTREEYPANSSRGSEHVEIYHVYEPDGRYMYTIESYPEIYHVYGPDGQYWYTVERHADDESRGTHVLSGGQSPHIVYPTAPQNDFSGNPSGSHGYAGSFEHPNNTFGQPLYPQDAYANVENAPRPAQSEYPTNASYGVDNQPQQYLYTEHNLGHDQGNVAAEPSEDYRRGFDPRRFTGGSQHRMFASGFDSRNGNRPAPSTPLDHTGTHEFHQHAHHMQNNFAQDRDTAHTSRRHQTQYADDYSDDGTKHSHRHAQDTRRRGRSQVREGSRYTTTPEKRSYRQKRGETHNTRGASDVQSSFDYNKFTQHNQQQAPPYTSYEYVKNKKDRASTTVPDTYSARSHRAKSQGAKPRDYEWGYREESRVPNSSRSAPRRDNEGDPNSTRQRARTNSQGAHHRHFEETSKPYESRRSNASGAFNGQNPYSNARGASAGGDNPFDEYHRSINVKDKAQEKAESDYLNCIEDIKASPPGNLSEMDITKLDSHYRKASLKCHPDLHSNNPKATENFQKLSNCYEALKAIKEKKERLAV